MNDVCAACGAPLPAGTARCRTCRKVDLGRAREIGRAGAESLALAQRGQTAVRVLLYGSLALAFAVVGIESAFPSATPWRALAEGVLFLALIALGLLSLGRGGLTESLGGPARFAHILPAVVTGVVAGLAWWGWNLMLRAVQGLSAPETPLVASTFVWSYLMPGLVQECLARGVTWAALRRLRSPRATLLGTALQFALIYGIAWKPLGTPVRFGIGLLLGRLRERTGSLAPCLAAHALALGLALALPS